METIPAARWWSKDDIHAAYWEMEEALAKGRADGWRRSKDRNRYAARNEYLALEELRRVEEELRPELSRGP